MDKKFRAYDTKEKQWMFGYEYPNLGGFNLLGETVLLGGLNTVSSDKLFQDLVFMQFINILDINKKEIYVGDVLANKKTDGTTLLFKVFESKGGFVINRFQDDFFKPIDKIIFTEACADMQTFGFLEHCEVVGSYIVNPELYTKND